MSDSRIIIGSLAAAFCLVAGVSTFAELATIAALIAPPFTPPFTLAPVAALSLGDVDGVQLFAAYALSGALVLLRDNFWFWIALIVSTLALACLLFASAYAVVHALQAPVSSGRGQTLIPVAGALSFALGMISFTRLWFENDT